MIARALGWLSRRRPWPAGLRGRLIALLLIALVASQAISLIFFFDERRLAVRAALAGEAVSRTASVALLLQRTPPELHQGVLDAASTPLARFALGRESAVAGAVWRHDPGRLRARLVEALNQASDEDWADRVAVAITVPEGAFAGWRYGPGRDPHDRMHAAMHAPQSGPPRPLQLVAAVALGQGRWLNVETRFRRPPLQWAWPSVLSLGLSAVAIVVIVSLTVGRITGPLRRLAAAADRFGRGGDDDAALPETGPAEARRLIGAFNAMRARLSRFVADRTQMLAAISHDLRTPITAMRLRAELVEEAETRAKLIDGLDEMQRMTEASLAFARDDAAADPMRPLDLVALADSLAEDFAEMGQDVRLLAGGPARLVVDCRADAVRRALRNLIENAVRYGERARISVLAEGEMARIRVEDDGPGIPTDQREAVFEPFKRLEKSRNRATGGVGLGLSIARSLARRHGGDIHLEPPEQGGFAAELRLPMAGSDLF